MTSEKKGLPLLDSISGYSSSLPPRQPPPCGENLRKCSELTAQMSNQPQHSRNLSDFPTGLSELGQPTIAWLSFYPVGCCACRFLSIHLDSRHTASARWTSRPIGCWDGVMRSVESVVVGGVVCLVWLLCFLNQPPDGQSQSELFISKDLKALLHEPPPLPNVCRWFHDEMGFRVWSAENATALSLFERHTVGDIRPLFRLQHATLVSEKLPVSIRTAEWGRCAVACLLQCSPMVQTGHHYYTPVLTKSQQPVPAVL